MYYGEEPDVRQAALYEAFPTARGFSDDASDYTLFRAVLHTALVQTVPADSEREGAQTTYLFFPQAREEWVINSLRETAEMIFARFRDEGRVEAAKFVGRSFKALRLGHLVHQVPGAPPRWAAFGFKQADPIPEWLRVSLLS